MKKTNTPEYDEADIDKIWVSSRAQQQLNLFLKILIEEDFISDGSLALRSESPKFVLTMRLERKKETK